MERREFLNQQPSPASPPQPPPLRRDRPHPPRVPVPAPSSGPKLPT